jgi:hypothetical protein
LSCFGSSATRHGTRSLSSQSMGKPAPPYHPLALRPESEVFWGATTGRGPTTHRFRMRRCCRLTRARRSACPRRRNFGRRQLQVQLRERPAAGHRPNGTAGPGCVGCRCWRRFPYVRTSDRIVLLARVCDGRQSRNARRCPGHKLIPISATGSPRPVTLRLAEGGGPLARPECQISPAGNFSCGLRIGLRDLGEGRAESAALSVSVARAGVASRLQTPLTKKILAASNQSVTASNLVNLRLTLNFLPRGPNRST